MDDAYIPRAQIVSVTGHRNDKSLDDYIDSFSTVCSKQLSNIISGRETVTGIETAVSFLVHPQQRQLINNCNSQFWDLGDLGAGRRTDESEKKRRPGIFPIRMPKTAPNLPHLDMPNSCVLKLNYLQLNSEFKPIQL